MSTGAVAIVVPCYDEAQRLDLAALAQLADRVDRVVLVDDGSRDGTASLLGEFAEGRGNVEVLVLESNVGKAEAVRAGLSHALATGGAEVVGYFDADIATPVSELCRLVEILDERRDADVAIASRVGLLGAAIDRSPARHYLGRLYATAASMALGIRVYDTQCGAKVFRADRRLAGALAERFPDRWSFDVELLARLSYPLDGSDPATIIEVPVREWRDVGGSKVAPFAALRALAALWGVRRGVRRRRQRRRPPRLPGS